MRAPTCGAASIRVRIVSVCAVLALALVACGGQSTPAQNGGVGGTLRFAWLGDLTPIWHPAGYETFGQSVVFSLLFDNLVRVGPDGHTIVPDLADSWTANADKTQFTFRLHHGVKWQDGTPFTSKDVAFTVTQSLSYHNRFTNQSWKAIKGADAVASGASKTLSGLETPDDYTVTMTLSAPGPDFLTQLSDSYNVIVPQHILQGVPPAGIEKAAFSTTSPVGTGPYKFVKYVTDQYVQLAANPSYFRGKPKMSQLFMMRYTPDVAQAQLESGNLGLALRLNPTAYSRIKSNHNLKTLSVKGVGQTSAEINLGRVPDKRVRQAIYYAINRQAIVKSVFKGRAEALNVPPGFKSYSDLNRYGYDPGKAKSLLKEAGFDTSAPFRIIYDQTYPLVPQYMPIIQQNLKQVGINAELDPMDSTAFIARSTGAGQRGTWEMAMENGGAEGLSPAETATYYHCKEPNVGAGYTNCQLDQLFAAAGTTADPSKRDDLYHQAARILNTDLPSLSLWNPDILSAATARLGGGFRIPQNTKETFFTVTTWTLSGSG
jgi:ABC-type transport system substrate-binding protein